jgi:hypothetical protein
MDGSRDAQTRPAPPENRPDRRRRTTGRGPSDQARRDSSGSGSPGSSSGETLLGIPGGASGSDLYPGTGIQQGPVGARLAQNPEGGFSRPLTASSLPLPKAGEVRGREGARQGIIVFLCFMFAASVGVAALAAFKGGDPWKNIQGLLDLVFPVETALIGTAVAFYYTTD